MDQQYCRYYLAEVKREKTSFFVGIMRSFEHVSLDRTLDKQTGTFEFFVPSDQEQLFLAIMEHMQEIGVVAHLRQGLNRLQQEHALLS